MGRGGCNSILVLHQPSFALYSLFDRVLLLAKGGLTVYLGPADGALGYFTNKLGYTPPTDFMNPADMFMDLIAGKIRPANASSPCSEIQSPQPTPEADQSVLRSLEGHTRIDLKLSDSDDEGGKACNAEDEAGDGRDSNEGTPLSSSDEENWNATAFLTEAWVKHKIKRQDSMHAPSSMFVKHSPEENSSPAREMASPLAMFFAFTSRAVTQFTRQPGVVAKDMMIQLLTGAFFGMVYMDARFSQLMLSTYMLTLALGLTISLASLRVYGSELVVFWREAAPGGGMALSRFAYFSAKALVELPRLALLTLCLLATFYALTSPVGSFRMYFTILYAGAFAVSGVSYIISIVLQQHSAQLAAVFITLVLFIAGAWQLVAELCCRHSCVCGC